MNNKEIGLIVKKLKKLLGKGKHILHEHILLGKLNILVIQLNQILYQHQSMENMFSF